MFFAAGPVEAAVTAKSMSWDVPPEKRGTVGFGSLADVVNTLEEAVKQGPYLLGEKFSAVDVYLGSQIGWGTQFKTIEDRPSFKPYLERIMSRPAAVRARAIDDALLPKKPA
jgi:glutathione S-transferase